MCKTVEDAALLLSVIAGYDERDHQAAEDGDGIELTRLDRFRFVSREQ
jgi:Asp-tRNA(Asn)/Glu-tRNA(Gln) amidotransferase A subunit family amidase